MSPDRASAMPGRVRTFHRYELQAPQRAELLLWRRSQQHFAQRKYDAIGHELVQEPKAESQ